MGSPRVLFVTDAGAEIGGGHVMRCLTLARELIGRGASCDFVASPDHAAILDVFGAPEIGRVMSPSADPEAMAVAAAGAADGFDAFVFDSFRLDAVAHRAVARGRPTLAIDNLADRPLQAHILAEPDPGRDPADYAGLLPQGARLLLGPEFALVRPEFAATRPASLARRGGEVRRLMVSMGLTDVGGITGKVVGRMLPRLGEAVVDVVLGPTAPSLPGLQTLAARDPRVRVHMNVRDMAGLMADADLAIGAGGASIWERCTLGLPALLVVLAANQAAVGAWLDREGACLTVDARAGDFEAAFDRAFTGLMRSPDRVARLSAKSAGLCDGQGAGRMAEVFLGVIAAAPTPS